MSKRTTHGASLFWTASAALPPHVQLIWRLITRSDLGKSVRLGLHDRMFRLPVELFEALHFDAARVHDEFGRFVLLMGRCIFLRRAQ